ncbi:MAG: 1,2-phenylacetyl-CoA epoxidase subunit PaaC [Asticcacaulis sp.]
MRQPIFDYTIRLGDDALILGQRLSAWCGRAPGQALDLNLSSLALDLVGQATYWLELAAKYDEAGRDADALAFHRAANDYHNCLLVEQPNGDFPQTLARQFLFSQYHYLFLDALKGSADPELADIAAKCLHDMAYHVEFTQDWMVRLGDGDCVSHQRLLKSMDYMYHFVDELFVMDEIDEVLLGPGISIDKTALRPAFDERVAAILREAGLTPPKAQRAVMMGRRGHDHHHVSHMLHDMKIPMGVSKA